MALRAEFERRRPPTKKQTSTPDGKPAGCRHWAKPPFALLAGRRGILDAPKKRVRHHWSGSGKKWAKSYDIQVFRLQTDPRAKVVLEPKIPVDGSGKTQPAGFRKIPAETTNDFHRIKPRPHKTLSGLAESRVPAYRLPLPSPNRSDRSLPRQAANRE